MLPMLAIWLGKTGGGGDVCISLPRTKITYPELWRQLEVLQRPWMRGQGMA